MSLLQLDSSTYYAFQNFRYYMFVIFVLMQQALQKEWEFNFTHQKYLIPMFCFQNLQMGCGSRKWPNCYIIYLMLEMKKE